MYILVLILLKVYNWISNACWNIQIIWVHRKFSSMFSVLNAIFYFLLLITISLLLLLLLSFTFLSHLHFKDFNIFSLLHFQRLQCLQCFTFPKTSMTPFLFYQTTTSFASYFRYFHVNVCLFLFRFHFLGFLWRSFE